jgi:hypothetical protein
MGKSPNLTSFKCFLIIIYLLMVGLTYLFSFIYYGMKPLE